LEIVVLIGSRLVTKVRPEICAQCIEVRGEHPGDVSARVTWRAGRRTECGTGGGLAIVFEAGEEEQPILDDRPTQRNADVAVLEGAGIEFVRTSLGANEIVITRVVKD